MKEKGKEVNILLVEDNPGDVRLTQEAFKESSMNVNLNVAFDGEEALEYLFNTNGTKDTARPDIILLDLNLPKKNGMEVLEVIKQDDKLKTIPVIILSTSDAAHDIHKSYQLHANCFIIKPVDFDEFIQVINLIEKFWFKTAQLPPE